MAIFRWADVFLVYSCNSLVKFSFTLHGKVVSDTSSSRSVFLGQCVIDASKFLQESFFSGKPVRVKGDLGRMGIEPRDQKFGSCLNKSEDVSSCEESESLGKVSFNIYPVTNVESKCGVLEEIVSTVLKGARKKWYAVLADKQLFLFSQFGDSRPKVVIPLQNGLRIAWLDQRCNVIKLSDLNNQATWLLTCGNKQHLQAWHNKVSSENQLRVLVYNLYHIYTNLLIKIIAIVSWYCGKVDRLVPKETSKWCNVLYKNGAVATFRYRSTIRSSI